MVASFVFAGLLSSSLTTHPPKRLFSLPDPLNVDFQLREKGSGFGAQSVHVSIEYYDKGKGDGFYEECMNTCIGGQHMGHEECTSSCDIACTAKFHDTDFYPELDSDDGYSELKQKLSSSALSAGTPDYAGEMTDLIWQSMKIPLNSSTYEDEKRWPCWNKENCSSAYRGFPTNFVGVKVTFQYMNLAGTMSLDRDGKSQTVYLATYEVPDIQHPEEGTDLYCRCGPSRRMIQEIIKKYITNHDSGILITDPMGTRPPSDIELLKYGVQMRFPDMNNAVLTASNPTGMDVAFTVLPGTRFISKDPETQNMMVTKKMSLKIPSWGTPPPINQPLDLSSDFSLFQKGPMSVEGTAVCINMKKHAPTDKVTYTPSQAPTSALKLLGNQADNDRILGPWTQTRFWIASDAATFAEVQKAMFPKPTEGHYLRSLYDVARITHMNFKTSPLKECLEPKVIVGASASRKATEWFVETLSKANPTALANWVNANSGAFASLFAADAEAYATKHGADVGNALCSSSNKDVQVAGTTYLLNAVPEMAREMLIKNGGLAGLSKAIDSKDDVVVGKALDVAEAYRAKNLAFALVNMTTSSTELKTRAAKLLADIKK